MKKLLALVVALVLVMSLATVASAAEYPAKASTSFAPGLPAAALTLFFALSVKRCARTWAST